MRQEKLEQYLKQIETLKAERQEIVDQINSLANSLEEAKDLVIEAEQNGKVTWNDREISDITEV